SWKKIGTESAIRCIVNAATTTSRIRLRSAKSFEVNQEKPKAASALLGGDGDLLRPVAPHTHQDDDVLVLEQQEDRMAERGRAQAVPVKAAPLGAQTEFLGQFDQARDRHGIAVDQATAADRPDLGIDPVLRPETKEASERRLAADDIAGGRVCRWRVCWWRVCRLGVGGCFDGHGGKTAYANCERRALCPPAGRATARNRPHGTRGSGVCKRRVTIVNHC